MPNARDLLVSVEGLTQIPNTDYTVSTTTLTFTTGVTSGHLIDARYLALGPSGTAGATGPAGSAPDLTASGFALNTNLVATGAIVDDISGNLITTGQTLQTQITSNDGDISTLTTNLISTGQTLQTQITSNDSDISTLTTNLIATGQTLQVTGHLADTTTLESFPQGLNVGTSSDLASRKLHVVGDIEISGTIYQSGSVFEGGGGGGGGGSSTFLGLSDTPGSFTASKHVAVNSAGNALEFVDGGGSANGGTGLLEIGNQKFTGDGATSGYALTTSVNNENNLIVTVGGLVQTPVEDYTLSAGTGLYFDANIISGTEIDVRRITANSFSASDSVADVFTGDGVLSGFDLSFSPNSKAANVLVSLNGIIQQPDTAYSLNGTTINFASGTVASGDVVDARHITIGQAGQAGPAGSGWATTDQGYFTELSLAGSATGIVQYSSGVVEELDLADNKWDVSFIEEYDSNVSADSDYNSVALLLRFNGLNNATSTIDDGPSNHGVPTFNGSARISTVESKFGSSSLLFFLAICRQWVMRHVMGSVEK